MYRNVAYSVGCIATADAPKDAETGCISVPCIRYDACNGTNISHTVGAKTSPGIDV